MEPIQTLVCYDNRANDKALDVLEKRHTSRCAFIKKSRHLYCSCSSEEKPIIINIIIIMRIENADGAIDRVSISS